MRGTKGWAERGYMGVARNYCTLDMPVCITGGCGYNI